MKAALIRQKREALTTENPKLNPREQADRIGVTEGALVASGCGAGTIRFKRDECDRSAQLSFLKTLSPALAVTRNRAALLEVQGAYPACQFFEGLGWLEGTPIHLRATLTHWSEGFYVPADGPRAASLQFFDSDGVATHKTFLAPEAALDEAFIKSQQHRNQKPDFEWTRSATNTISENEASEIDHAAFMQKWQHMGEVHNFTRLMQRFRLSRLQAIRLAGEENAQRLNREAVREVLTAVSRQDIPMEVSVENTGVIHKWVGVLPELQSYGKWMNVLHDSFNLHMDESQVNQVWRVALPIQGGVVHVLEVFDKGDRPVFRLMPSQAISKQEPATWTELLKSCQPLSIDD